MVESETHVNVLATPLARRLRILFLGNAYNVFSVACANALADSKHEVVLAAFEPGSRGFANLVSDSWRKQGIRFLVRKAFTLVGCRLRLLLRRLGVRLHGWSSLAELAMARRIATMRLSNPNSQAFVSAVRESGIDLVVVGAFSRILKRDLIHAPTLGCINLHPSLLPEYRGPNPIYWVLENREKRTGVTVHYIDEGVDTGPILMQAELEIRSGESETSLMQRCARLAAELLPAVLDLVAQGKAVACAQDESQASYYPNPPRGLSLL